MREILKPGIALLLVTLVAAACIGTIYGITLEPIQKQKEKTEAIAMKKILPNADEFVADTQIPSDSKITRVTRGYSSGALEGHIIGVSPKGYGGEIEMLVGIGTDGQLEGVSIVSHSETAGLGANATKPAFTDQYTGQSGPFTVVKRPAGDNEIEAISSATITTQAVTNGVNDALAYYNDQLRGGN